MADPPVEGSVARPVSLDFFQNITEVHWGGADPIGLLTVDLPDIGPNLWLDPIILGMNGTDLGDVVQSPFGFSSDGVTTHPEPVVRLAFNGAAPILRVLLDGIADGAWIIEAMMPQPGPFPTNLGFSGILPPHPAATPEAHWEAYATGTGIGQYGGFKAGYLAAGSGYRFVEVADLKSLGADTIMGRTGYYGPDSRHTWADTTYGLWFLWRDGIPFHQDPSNVRLTTDFLGIPTYFDFAPNLIYDDPITLNFGVQQFDLYAPRVQVGWGLGERFSRGDKVNLLRLTFFIDFKYLGTPADTGGNSGFKETTATIASDGVTLSGLHLDYSSELDPTGGFLALQTNFAISGAGIPSGTRLAFDGSSGGTLSNKSAAGTGVAVKISQDRVAIGNLNPSFEASLGEYDMSFTYAVYPGSTKFTRSVNSVTADKAPIVPAATRKASYYKDGVLFQVDRKGFV